MKVSVKVETKVSASARVAQVSGMFDLPPQKKCSLEWHGELPIEDFDWNVGLIVGPSGCGKSTLLRECFGQPGELTWGAESVIDDFDRTISVRDASEACSAVGFNTIPAWLRPYGVLSNGERFRVDLARRILETPKETTIVVDEFTSVVDRQVAQVGSHAVQKYVRRSGKRFVAASCHYDIIDWLQPDWVLEPATMRFQRRELRRRPDVEVVLGRVPYSAWRLFAPYHYMSAELNKAARCYGLWANGRLAAFGGVLPRPHPVAKNVFGVSRVVTLPDWQGLGLAFVLLDNLGAAYRAKGRRFRNYPAHPAFVQASNRSKAWRLDRKPGNGGTPVNKSSGHKSMIGGRPCAAFEYVGPAMPREDAERLMQGA